MLYGRSARTNSKANLGNYNIISNNKRVINLTKKRNFNSDY